MLEMEKEIAQLIFEGYSVDELDDHHISQLLSIMTSRM
jgi:hypothetical protein